MNYKMTIQYDGGRYSGWQRQGNTANTIQGKLERALSRLLSQEIAVSGAGRTDAGVHALGQVANFKAEPPVADCDALLRALNEALPGDIAVIRLLPASPRFHARLSAKEKIYRYSIWNSPIPNVLERRTLCQIPEPLDLDRMRQGAELLLGTHDFSGFSTGHTKKSTVRHIRSVELLWDGDRVVLTFTGNGFLYNQIRIMVGTLIEIGLGSRAPDTIQAVLDTCDRQAAGYTAPPHGLCLMQVLY